MNTQIKLLSGAELNTVSGSGGGLRHDKVIDCGILGSFTLRNNGNVEYNPVQYYKEYVPSYAEAPHDIW